MAFTYTHKGKLVDIPETATRGDTYLAQDDQTSGPFGTSYIYNGSTWSRIHAESGQSLSEALDVALGGAQGSGDAGAPGDKGATGDKGPDGDKGATGDAGLSLISGGSVSVGITETEIAHSLGVVPTVVIPVVKGFAFVQETATARTTTHIYLIASAAVDVDVYLKG